MRERPTAADRPGPTKPASHRRQVLALDQFHHEGLALAGAQARI